MPGHRNSPRQYTNTVWQRIAYAAIIAPSSIWCGSRSISSRLLHVPGSDSSKFTVTYVGLPVSCGTNDHFMPVGEPGAAAAAQAGVLHHLDHVVGRHLQRQTQPDEAALRLVAGERPHARRRPSSR